MIAYLRWVNRWLDVMVWSIPGRVIALAFILSLFLAPIISQHPYLLRVLTLTAIFSIYAVSWDLLAGFVGQLNLGQGFFFAAGTYAAALINKHLGVPPLVSIPIGAAASLVIGLIAGIPALRLRGFYLGLVTLSFPIISNGIVFVFADFTGGEMGLFGVEGLSNSKVISYYIVLMVATCSIFIMYKLTDADSKNLRTGIIFRAIREDEITARTSGISTVRYKLLAFAVSGFFAGIAGGLYAHYIRIAGPSTLEIFFSFQPIIWTTFGGTTTIYGPVAGVFILFPLLELIRANPTAEEIRYGVFALILIFTVLFMPDGIAIWVRDKIEIQCQRCKVRNAITRQQCRACRAPLHLEN